MSHQSSSYVPKASASSAPRSSVPSRSTSNDSGATTVVKAGDAHPPIIQDSISRGGRNMPLFFIDSTTRSALEKHGSVPYPRPLVGGYEKLLNYTEGMWLNKSEDERNEFTDVLNSITRAWWSDLFMGNVDDFPGTNRVLDNCSRLINAHKDKFTSLQDHLLMRSARDALTATRWVLTGGLPPNDDE